MLRPSLAVVHRAASGQAAPKHAIRPSPQGRSGAASPAGQVTWPAARSMRKASLVNRLPGRPGAAELVRLAKIRWRAGHDYRELKTGLGLGHFEGRAYLGWHRHVTLAALAQAFCAMIRTDPSPCAGMTLHQVLRELQIVLAVILGACPLCCQPFTLDRLAAALAG